MNFHEPWRRAKSAAFDLATNSTARHTLDVDFWGQRRAVYANANLSIYSAEPCNARCTFCVEELRPASRGRELQRQKTTEQDDDRYFEALDATLKATAPLAPSVSITGGEASRDPRLPRILKLLASHGARKRVLTTNGSGLRDASILDAVCEAGLDHLNISIAHPDEALNARFMRFSDSPTRPELLRIVAAARAAGIRVRLSCVLLKEGIANGDDLRAYVAFAASVGVDNVIFRQLMKTDPATHARNHVVRYSDHNRVPLEPLLDALHDAADFIPVRQIMGYYYYVEVWRHGDVDVVFEEADLARLEAVKRADPTTVHELVFHPNGRLATTWQPWDGVLGP